MTIDTTNAPKETWFGFVKDRTDALLLINACYSGTLQPITLPFNSMCLRIRSGSVVVTVQKNDNQNYCFRWRDNLHWTASKLTDNFMLYRQVLHVNQKVKSRQNTINKSCRFHNGSLRSKSELIADGLAKRSWGTVGPDGFYYRVTHYFYPDHVEHFYNGGEKSASAPAFQRPCDIPMFEQYKEIAAEQFRVLESKPASPKQKELALPAEAVAFEPVVAKYNGSVVPQPPPPPQQQRVDADEQRRGSVASLKSASTTKASKAVPKRLQQAKQVIPLEHVTRHESIHHQRQQQPTYHPQAQPSHQRHSQHYQQSHSFYSHSTQSSSHHSHSKTCGCGPLPSLLRSIDRFPRFDERSLILPPLRVVA
ncbi:hypothetical protein BDR26DRAFT_871064 [Obelidium mucronatum]|nr:hypothetical protein BDR26DRAFT_871064 [Obelidium mucronatum]